MKQLKNKAKRMLAVLVSLVLIVGMLPVSAFALTEGAMILDHPSLRVTDDGSFTATKVPQLQGGGTLTSSAGYTIPEDKKLNVWIESSEMTADGENNGSAPPYFTDIFGRKWTLNKVALAGYATQITSSSLANAEVILSSDKIQSAHSKDDYVVDISDVSVEATKIYEGYYGYSVLYGWQCEADGGGLTDPESYTVSYDFTLPEGLTEKNVTVYPLLEYNGKETLSIGETDGSLSQVKTALKELESEVYSGQPYQVPYVDNQFIGFLVFDRNRNSASEESRNYDGFYKFTGWQVDGATNEELYPIGSTIDDISALSTGDSNGIKFVPKWEEIIPLDDTKLTADAEELPLDLFKRNAGVSGLLSQWVNDGDATDEAVTLGKDDILHYQVSTTLNGQLIYAQGGYKDEFAEFVLTINLDDSLEFANLDGEGKATITIEPGPLKVTNTNLGDAQNNKITFDPDAVQDGVITITLGWDTDANVISVDPTVITGLDFKLKDGATVITSSANITGYLDYYNQTDHNPRFHYEAAQDLLNSTFWVENAEGGSNTKLWYNHFHAGDDYITAFVHTLQVLDYKVTDIDLSKSNIGQVEANSVEARFTHTITATAGSNGTITPSGVVSVTDGANQTFTITPNVGYEIADVKVDGISQGAIPSYTFPDVKANHSIAATFRQTGGSHTGGGSGSGGSDHDSDPTGSLSISLDVNGGDDSFTFTVYLTDKDGDDLKNNFYYNGDYTGTIGSGDEITLTGGDKIVIRNLPEGTRYEVIIETADGYAVTSTGAEGVIRTSGNEAAFSVTPTVVLADPSVTGVTRWLNTTDHTAYLSGYPGGTFGPDNSMTRAEVAQMFYALLLNKDVTITKTFSDVPADAWYATAVNTLASLGMVSGDPDGTFRPNDPITRAEFCVIALAFAYEPDNAVCYFGDVSRSDWFYTYVAQAASYGWIGGYTNGNFGPNDRITRAQVTTIVNNMLGRAADRDYVIDHQADLVQFSDLTRAHWGYFQIMEATNAHNYTKSNGTESWR